MDITLSLTSCGRDRATAQRRWSWFPLWHKGPKPAVLRVKPSSDVEARSGLSPILVLRAVYLKVTMDTMPTEDQHQAAGLLGREGAEFSLHMLSSKPISQLTHSVKEKTKKLQQESQPGMSSGARMPGHGSTSYLLGSVFKYSLDLIHVFFPKVNNGEMNSPILLDARLPRKQSTCTSGPVFPTTGKAQTNTDFVEGTRV